MELVLRAARCRVDRQAQRIARHRVTKRLFDKTPRLPGISEVVVGEWRKERRVLDAAYLRRRNEQKLSRSADVFEHRESACQIDDGAWLRVAMLLLVWHALTVNDLPKHVWIGRLCGGAMGPQSDEQPGGDPSRIDCNPDDTPLFCRRDVSLERHRIALMRRLARLDAGEAAGFGEPHGARRQLPAPLAGDGGVPAHRLVLDVHALVMRIEQLDAMAVGIAHIDEQR